MNMTINCKCFSRLALVDKNPLYKGFGNAIELSVNLHENTNTHIGSGRTGRVVWPVSSGHPILVDSCRGSEYIVEMDLSSRYVVHNGWPRKGFYPTIFRLFERKIYPLIEVQRPDFDAVKSKLVKSYYSNDGKLRDSTFEHNLSPINMAEAGIGFLGGGSCTAIIAIIAIITIITPSCRYQSGVAVSPHQKLCIKSCLKDLLV